MKIIIQIVICFFTISLVAQTSNVNTLLSNSNQLHLNYSTGELVFDRTSINDATYTQILVNGLTKSYDIGNPELPVFSKLIEVPTSGGISVDVVNFNEHIKYLAALGFPQEILPSQESVFKNQDPTKI